MRGIHAGKDIAPPKQPLNISEVNELHPPSGAYIQFLRLIRHMPEPLNSLTDSSDLVGSPVLSTMLPPDLDSSSFVPAVCTNMLIEYLVCRIFLPKDNQSLTLVLGGTWNDIFNRFMRIICVFEGIRAPRTARNPSEKSEPYGPEAYEFASRRYMQRDVEFEVDTIDKSGGFIGSLYMNKTENIAIALAKEGLATVHSFSADGLSWARQLYDAEVHLLCYTLRLFTDFFSRRKQRPRSATSVLGLVSLHFFSLFFWTDLERV